MTLDEQNLVLLGELKKGMELLDKGQIDIFTRLGKIEARLNTSKGVILGLTVAAGGIGASAKEILTRMFHS